MGPLVLLSLILGLAAQVLATIEKDFIPTPVDMNAMPKMVGTRSSTPGDNTSYADSFQMGTTTFFYTLDDGTKFSYHGESRVSRVLRQSPRLDVERRFSLPSSPFPISNSNI